MDKQRGIVVDALCRLLVAQADSVLASSPALPAESGDSPPSSSSLPHSDLHLPDSDQYAMECSSLTDVDHTFRELQKWTDLSDNKVSRTFTIHTLSYFCCS